MSVNRRRLLSILIAAVLAFWQPGPAAQPAGSPLQPGAEAPPAVESDPMEVLSTGQWKDVEQSVDRALAWMSGQQRREGEFASHELGQPAVSSLCLMAFLARGHRPGEGPYGRHLDIGIDYVLSCQRPSGLISRQMPGWRYVSYQPSHTAAYNHVISSVLLAEVYGMTRQEKAVRIQRAIEAALKYTLEWQAEPKTRPIEVGGWRAVVKHPPYSESDLSVTGWQLMFLRASRNAGFEIPIEAIDQAVAYAQRCFDPARGGFLYSMVNVGNERALTRGMTGAGILSLSLGGLHQTPMAQRAGDWLLQHPYRQYGEMIGFTDRFHYSAYYCCQGMFQLGGHYWAQFFPPLVNTLLNHQQADGAWPTETSRGKDAMFGQTLSTSLSVLTLTVPYQLLPIYQR